MYLWNPWAQLQRHSKEGGMQKMLLCCAWVHIKTSKDLQVVKINPVPHYSMPHKISFCHADLQN